MRRYAFLLPVIGFAMASACCQVLPSDISQGLHTYESYQAGAIDHISLSSGILGLKIPLVGYPQRGRDLKLSFSVYFNSKPYVYQEICPPKVTCSWLWQKRIYNYSYYPAAGSYIADDQDVRTIGYIETIQDTNPVTKYSMVNWQTADGSIHPGAFVSGGSAPSGQVSIDGSGYFNGYNIGSYDSNGNYIAPSCSQYCFTIDSEGISYYPSSSIIREDSNGNQIVSTTQNGQPAWQDTVGRIIPSVPSASTSGDSTHCTGTLPTYSISVWQVPGVNGSTYTFKFCYAQITLSAPPPTSGLRLSGTETVLQSIVLPNDTAWTFQYAGDGQGNNYGDLTQVTFPTGGTITYGYSTLEAMGGVWSRWVTSKIENANDGQGNHTWAYSYANAGGGTSPMITTVTDPLGNQQVHTLTLFGGSGSPLYETETQEYSGAASSGTLLKTTTRTYQYSAGFEYLYGGSDLNVFPTTTTVALAGGKTMETATQYCCSFSFAVAGPGSGGHTANWGRPSDVKVYDYGSGSPGPLLKESYRTYIAQISGSYLAEDMIGPVSSETTYNGSGTQVALTSYTYDESAYLTSSGVTAQHSSPLLPLRGNLTTTTAWLNGGTSPASHTNWYDTGEIYQSIDAKGNPAATYAYSSTYLGSLPTQITNALNQTTTYVYDFNTGQKTSVTDPNSQTTTYAYNDPLGRVTNITYPNVYQSTHGESTFTYNDTASPVNFVFSKLMTPDPTFSEQVNVDGFGREWYSELTSDPQGPVYTEKTYDPLGRLYQVWNATRCVLPGSTSCSGETTWGSVTHQYDALNRPLVETQQDGGQLQFSYSGNEVTSTDETGRIWERTSDALGRLTQVLEPDGSATIGKTPTLETDYQYDALNNLTRVDQWGGPSGNSSIDRVRTFSYDSLSRLISASNPESGTTTYGYLASGILCSGDLSLPCSKTNANSVAINYSYDALNRLTLETSPSWSWSYTYDIGTTPGGFSSSNSVGRLVESSNGVNASEQYSYDPLGRVAYKANCVPSNCSQTGNAFYAQYDLAENPIQFTYPDGRVLQEAWNGANRLQSATYANWNGTAVGYNYVSAATYWPDGSPETMTYGNGIAQTFARNRRLQPIEISAQANANGISEKILDKQYCYGPTSDPAAPFCTTAGGNDNGNILQALDPLSSANSQSFSYDNMNRIASFSNGNGSMQQTYSIDPWGNLSQSGTLSSVLTYGTNNRATNGGYGYDAAGNVTSVNNGTGTVNYTYDPEGRILTGNNGAATYTYNPDGQRLRKDFGGSWTEYLYFDGQTLAEHNADGSWSDYIYADGRRIARADSFDVRIHTHGTNPGGDGASWDIPGPSYVVKSNDKLVWRQFQNGAYGGPNLQFSDGTQTHEVLLDNTGQPVDVWHTESQWGARLADLSNYAGKTITTYQTVTDPSSPAGTYDIYLADLAIVSADGTVTPIYYRQMGASLPNAWNGGETSLSAVEETSNSAGDAEQPNNTTTYYISDQIGSSRMLSAGEGWPVSMDSYYPFGQEPSPPTDNNHYKFTGKQRDSESGLDYFGARYYASSMGRWLSPDWSATVEPVPYAKLDDPQSLNLYGYVQNNPLTSVDAEGHDLSVLPDAYQSRAGAALWTFETGEQTSAVPTSSLGDSGSAQQQNDCHCGTKHSFKTVNQAATAALNKIFPTAEKQHIEYGGRIYRNANGTYSYTTVVTQHNATEVDVDAGGPEGSRIPAGTVNVGDYHTHETVPGYVQDRFSYGDAAGAVRMHERSYIETPSGLIHEIDGRSATSYLAAPQYTWPANGPIP